MAKKTYYFVVHTCDEYLAGTDSNIFVTLHGEKGVSESQRLNGHISGNAFERNNYDVFSVDYDHDVGEVYKIVVQTDAKYGGSDWKCNYIRVSTGKIEKDSGEGSHFVINEWITKKNHDYSYNVTSGYNYKTEPPEETNVVIKKGKLFVPANSTYTGEVKTSLTYNVDYSKVTTTEIGSETSVKVEVDILEADFSFKINKTIEETSNISLNKTQEFTQTVSISEPSDKPRTYDILWNEHSDRYNIEMGSLKFDFSIPVELTFAGLKEITEEDAK